MDIEDGGIGIGRIRLFEDASRGSLVVLFAKSLCQERVDGMTQHARQDKQRGRASKGGVARISAEKGRLSRERASKEKDKDAKRVTILKQEQKEKNQSC